MYPVLLMFDVERGELSIRIGTNTLIIDKFIRDSSTILHQSVLSPYGQEQVIKKLVANMELKD